MPSHPLNHPLLSLWLGVLSRCHVPSHPAYKHYGGRGIHVSRRWMRFEHFARDLGPRPTKKHSVERLDVDGPYSKKNCVWATATTQNRNTRRTRRLTYKGRTAPLTEWAETLNICPETIHGRLRRGWPVELALSTPSDRPEGELRVRARRCGLLCKAAGISVGAFHYRLSKGWSEHDALNTPPSGKRPPRPIDSSIGITEGTYYARLRRGWSKEDALHTPPRQRPKSLPIS